MIEDLYHKEDPDGRTPACYLLTYRGTKYWHCYGIHLVDWFESILKLKIKSKREG
jgi:hypothetical protein